MTHGNSKWECAFAGNAAIFESMRRVFGPSVFFVRSRNSEFVGRAAHFEVVVVSDNSLLLH